jgi:single-strand DNA-binding protein
MFDTYVTIVGNVLTTPEWRKTKNTGAVVAHFKVASTARRLDRETGKWVDGDSLRVRVTCWRRLAEGVGASIISGDPVIVIGRMYTRDWIDDAGMHRVMYELEAVAVGHDMSRGKSRFTRNRPPAATSSVEDGQDGNRVGGQVTEPVPDDEVPAHPDDGSFDELDEDLPPLSLAARYGPPGTVFSPDDALTAGPVDGAEDDEQADEDVDGEDLAGDDLGEEDDLLGDGLPGSGDDGSGAIGADTDGLGDAGEAPRRSRRRVRTPVPA